MLAVSNVGESCVTRTCQSFLYRRVANVIIVRCLFKGRSWHCAILLAHWLVCCSIYIYLARALFLQIKTGSHRQDTRQNKSRTLLTVLVSKQVDGKTSSGGTCKNWIDKERRRVNRRLTTEICTQYCQKKLRPNLVYINGKHSFWQGPC